MKYCEDDLPVKIVFANDLLKFFGDALVAMLNEETPPAIPSSVREMLTECAELGGFERITFFSSNSLHNKDTGYFSNNSANSSREYSIGFSLALTSANTPIIAAKAQIITSIFLDFMYSAALLSEIRLPFRFSLIFTDILLIPLAKRQ